MNNQSKRSYVIIAVFALTGLIFIVRLFGLQVLDPTYKQFATNNVLREVVQYPARGLVYDRNGKLLVYNKPAYDLLITPREVTAFDTTYFCQLLEITREDLKERIKKAKEYSSYKPSILIKQISPESYAILQEQLYKFRGFHTQSRTLREYSTKSAAHVLGYVGEVTNDDIRADSYYKMGDYIGVSGIEKSYEAQLRGTKGIKKFMVDVHNRIQGSYLNGEEDAPAQIGNNLKSTLDIDLQQYAEELLQNKKGSVVAIEPATGEILTMVSAPAYDPGLLVGRIRGNNYAMLLSDTLKPLFDRAMQAEYPPGSTFKPITVLIALQEQTIDLNTRFSCSGPASVPIRCTHNHITPLGVIDAIRESCNPFMWNTFRSVFNKYKTSAEGLNVWRNYVLNFGMGQKMGVDLPNEGTGNVPTEQYYSRIHGPKRWSSLTIRSLSIGQGELGVTPLQLANYTAAIGNRGYYHIPHIVKEVENGMLDAKYQTKIDTRVEKEYFETVIKGMELVVQGGTAAMSRIQGISLCGKTGTAQNPHGAAHSVFMAFAPKDDPKIAIAVYIENGVSGARYAAPIASLIVEKYLNDSISSGRKWLEEAMLKANLLKNPYQPLPDAGTQ